MKFRAATKKDKDGLKKLDAASSMVDIFGGKRSLVLNKKGLVDFYISKNGLLVVEENGKIIGYILSQPVNWMHGINRMIWIEHIGIHPDYRGVGVGKKLIDYAKKYYKGKAKYLYGEIHPKNKNSIALFKSCRAEFADRVLSFVKIK